MLRILEFIARVRFAFFRTRMRSVLHRVDELGHKQFSSVEAMRDRSIESAIRRGLDKYWRLVSRDQEMWGILQYYQVTRDEVEELRGIFQRCGIRPAEGMSLPFPLEYATYLMRTDSQDEYQRYMLIHCVHNCAQGYANEEQRCRYAEMFGEQNIRSF